MEDLTILLQNHWLLILLILIILFAIWKFVNIYNSIIVAENEIDNMKGAIDSLLKMKFNLIDNLVNIVKGYMKYERETLEKIVRLRNKVDKEKDFIKRNEIDREINPYLRTLFIQVENYPELKANQNVLDLQRTLYDIESQIAAARRGYNDAIVNYNNIIETFPSNIVANMFNFKPKKVFRLDESRDENIYITL
ncbi:MAG: LemA family protein [Persephonella sp.]|nr:MAG: LemA family protein [Persephonella sp.]